MEDPGLLFALRHGDRQALDELYRRHAPLVWRFALGLARDEQLAAEALQEAFLVLMREPERYDPSRAALGTWLCGIARNRVRKLAVREARFEGGANLPEPADPGAGPLAVCEREQSLELLRAAVEALPADFREVVLLCAYEEMPYEEAAAALGIPVGTVRSRLARAKAMLGKVLTEGRMVTHGTAG